LLYFKRAENARADELGASGGITLAGDATRHNVGRHLFQKQQIGFAILTRSLIKSNSRGTKRSLRRREEKAQRPRRKRIEERAADRRTSDGTQWVQ